jgi:hypothetical protein
MDLDPEHRMFFARKITEEQGEHTLALFSMPPNDNDTDEQSSRIPPAILLTVNKRKPERKTAE